MVDAAEERQVDAEEEGDVLEGHRYPEDTIVSKDFNGEVFLGRVVERGWDGVRRTYKVRYSDGDEEVMDEEALAEIVEQQYEAEVEGCPVWDITSARVLK